MLYLFPKSMRSTGDISISLVVKVSSSIALVRTSLQSNFEDMASSSHHSFVGIWSRRTLKQDISRVMLLLVVNWDKPGINEVQECHKLPRGNEIIDGDRSVV